MGIGQKYPGLNYVPFTLRKMNHINVSFSRIGGSFVCITPQEELSVKVSIVGGSDIQVDKIGGAIVKVSPLLSLLGDASIFFSRIGGVSLHVPQVKSLSIKAFIIKDSDIQAERLQEITLQVIPISSTAGTFNILLVEEGELLDVTGNTFAVK